MQTFMNKIFYTAMSLITMLLMVSCSNDDINIEKVGRKYNLSLSVNTQSLYDQFGITNSVRDKYLRDGSRQVGLFMYLYDAKGDFVKSDQSFMGNYNTTSFQLGNLVEGKYTVVVVETLVNPDDNYSIETFTLDDSEQLSTLKITEKTETDSEGNVWAQIAWAPEVIGVYTKEVNLTSNTNLDATPEAIGSVVKFDQYYWDKTDYVTIGWATKDVLNYYSINPSMSRENRYNKNLTVQGNTNVRALFEVNDTPMDYYGIYVLEKEIDWLIVYQDETSIADSKVYVSDAVNTSISDGKVYFIGTYLGKDANYRYQIFENQNDLNNWKTNLDNTVGPYSKNADTSLYSIPYINWQQGSVSAVKSFMKDFTMVEDLTLQTDGTYRITYYDSSNGAFYWYDFKTSTSGLTDSYIILSKEIFTLDQVKEELVKEGYSLFSQSDSYSIYVNANKTTAVLLDETESFFFVNYYDPSAYASSSVQKKQNVKINDALLLNMGLTPRVISPLRTNLRKEVNTNIYKSGKIMIN